MVRLPGFALRWPPKRKILARLGHSTEPPSPAPMVPASTSARFPQIKNMS